MFLRPRYENCLSFSSCSNKSWNIQQQYFAHFTNLKALDGMKFYLSSKIQQELSLKILTKLLNFKLLSHNPQKHNAGRHNGLFQYLWNKIYP